MLSNCLSAATGCKRAALLPQLTRQLDGRRVGGRAPGCCVVTSAGARRRAGEGPCLATFFVTRYWQLLLLRMLTSISIGGALPLVCSLVGDLFFVRQRTGVMACVQVAVAAGLVLGHALAGFVGAPGPNPVSNLKPIDNHISIAAGPPPCEPGRPGVPPRMWVRASGRGGGLAGRGPCGRRLGRRGPAAGVPCDRPVRRHEDKSEQDSTGRADTDAYLGARPRIGINAGAGAARRLGLGLALAVRAGRAAGAGGGGTDAGHHARAAARLHRGGAQRAPPLPRTPANSPAGCCAGA